MRTLNTATRDHLLRDPEAIEFSRDEFGETYKSYRPDINRAIVHTKYYDGGHTTDYFNLSSGKHTSGEDINANGRVTRSSIHAFGGEINTTLPDRFLSNLSMLSFHLFAKDLRSTDLKPQPTYMRAPGYRPR